MAVRKKKRSFNKELTEQIIVDLTKGMDQREVAKKYNVQQKYVFTIYNMNRTRICARNSVLQPALEEPKRDIEEIVDAVVRDIIKIDPSSEEENQSKVIEEGTKLNTGLNKIDSKGNVLNKNEDEGEGYYIYRWIGADGKRNSFAASTLADLRAKEQDLGIIIFDQPEVNTIIDVTPTEVKNVTKHTKTELNGGISQMKKKTIKGRKDRAVLTARDKVEIYDLYNNKHISTKELARRYNCSVSSVNRIYNFSAHEILELLNKIVIEEGSLNKSEQELKNKLFVSSIKATNTYNIAASLPVKTTTEQTNTNNHGLVELFYTPYADIGLVDERHDLPVSKYIFQTINSDLMFDYEKQFQIAKERIKEFTNYGSGNASEGIRLYVTGLQCALGAVTKACIDLKIGLILMHYNASLKAYCSQPIIESTKVTSNCSPIFYDLINKNRHVYTMNCTTNDLIKAGTFLEVSEAYYTSTKDLDSVDIVLFSNPDSAWTYYQSKVMNRPDHKGVYINFAKVENNKYQRIGNISKYTNY